MQRAVVLLSGGVDSTTTLAVARERGFETCALTFRYGQRHAVEVEAARRVAPALGAVRHEFVDIGLRAFGGSALTADIDVPKDRAAAEIGTGASSTPTSPTRRVTAPAAQSAENFWLLPIAGHTYACTLASAWRMWLRS